MRKKVYISQSVNLPVLNYCPVCNGGPLDGATAVDFERGKRATPKAGDFTVCAYCGAMLRFIHGPGEILNLRLALGDELAELDSETRELFEVMAKGAKERPLIPKRKRRLL